MSTGPPGDVSRSFNTIQVREMVRGGEMEEEMGGEMGREGRRGGKGQRRGE